MLIEMYFVSHRWSFSNTEIREYQIRLASRTRGKTSSHFPFDRYRQSGCNFVLLQPLPTCV